MRKPIKIGSERFLKLQELWYAKDAVLAAKRGEKDVERYQDFNKMPVSTMPKQHGSLRFFTVSEDEEVDDEAEVISLSDTDKAAFWREVGRKASMLTKSDPLYRLVNSFAERGSFAAAAVECKVSGTDAKNKLRGWLSSVGLKPATGLSRRPTEPQPEPSPVRHLTPQEIAKLDLQPPRSK